jgi:hypothetical protein
MEFHALAALRNEVANIKRMLSGEHGVLARLDLLAAGVDQAERDSWQRNGWREWREYSDDANELDSLESDDRDDGSYSLRQGPAPTVSTGPAPTASTGHTRPVLLLHANAMLSQSNDGPANVEAAK